ncbi:MAG: putative metal-dependent hydrolase [Candidatus Deianiraeaceae bacterium]
MKTVSYKIIQSKRKTVSIQICHTGKVVVRSPLHIAKYKVEELVQKKQLWIEAKLQEIQLRNITAITYTENEQFHFMGVVYTLKILLSNKIFVSITGNNILTHKKESAETKAVLENFLRKKAEEIYSIQMALCFEHFTQFFQCPFPELKVRKMKSCWGSCSSNGKITLALALIHAPLECINYVIFHELCHLKHQNHGKDFYVLQTRINPEWGKHKAMLKFYTHYSK